MPRFSWVIVATLALSGASAPPVAAVNSCPGQDQPRCDFLWINAKGRPSSAALDALVLLDDADSDGLSSADYAPATLRARAEAVAAGTVVTAEIARFDIDLTAAMVRFLRDLHAGRVEPTTVGAPDLGEPDDPDYFAVLRDAVGADRLGALVRGLAPPGAQYAAIRRELARYRDLAHRGAHDAAGLARLPLLVPGRSGDVRALRAWLTATGDLRTDSTAPASEYSGAIVEATRQFQARHGLRPDGIVGAQTVKALSTPLATRIRQLELALERLRWLRALGPGRLVAINIPMFRLWAWDRPTSRTPPAVSMNSVVGRAGAAPTPMFFETITHVVLGPYWNIPHSIVVNEVLPIVARDPGYLRRAHLEIVKGATDSSPIVLPTPQNLARLRAGTLRLRQRPGPGNALGSIKFAFPNEHQVALHGTSAPGVFAAARRDVSHGCIRIEDPVALAAWALQGVEEWSGDLIARTAPSAVSLRVELMRPVRVLAYYTTAAVGPDDGLLHFAEDIYGWDRALDRALRERR